MAGILRRLLSLRHRWARRRFTLALAFLLLGLPAGAGLAWFTPMGDVSDEPAHLARADGVLHGQIIGFKSTSAPQLGVPGVGVDVDSSMIGVSLTELFPTLNGKTLAPAIRRQAEAIRWAGDNVYFPTQMVEYFPAFYLPGAAGLWMGRLVGCSPLQSAFLGRLFMLASYLAMGVAALRLARFGQPIVFTVLLLPVSLMLGASFSQDGQLVAATALAAALLTRDGPKPGPAWLTAIGLLVLMVCSKPSYAPLLGLGLLPLAPPGFLKRLGLTVAALLPPLAWMRLMTSCCYTDWLTPPYHPGPLWPGSGGVTLNAVSAAGNLAVLRAHPAQIFILPARLLVDEGGVLWWKMIGALGWNSLRLPSWQIWGWSVALAGAVLACMAQPGPGPRWRDASFAALLIAGAYCGVGLALYLSYTMVGQTEILGVQGRYFLLFWPVLPFLLPRGKGWRRPECLALMPALAMAAADAWALPAFSWHLYHMAGP